MSTTYIKIHLTHLNTKSEMVSSRICAYLFMCTYTLHSTLLFPRYFLHCMSAKVSCCALAKLAKQFLWQHTVDTLKVPSDVPQNCLIMNWFSICAIKMTPKLLSSKPLSLFPITSFYENTWVTIWSLLTMVCSVSMTTAIYYHGDLVSQMLLASAGSQMLN